MTLPFSEAAARNQGPIGAVLEEWLGGRALRVLEIGAGTGQHAVYFAGRFPALVWQPADIGDYLPGLRERVASYAGTNLLPPIELNVDVFPAALEADVIYTANTLHIMAWTSAQNLLREAGRCLPVGGQLIIYGPFNVGGQFTSDSNRRFDQMLREQQAHMGIRGREEVCRVADRAGLSLQKVHAMPANNQMLIFARRRRQSPGAPP